MQKRDRKYIIIACISIVSFFITELIFINPITILLWILYYPISIICVISILYNWRKRSKKLISILTGILLLPWVIFSSFNYISNYIKGEIIFNAIDKSFATTRSIIIREKDNKLNAFYMGSVAGIGEEEKADIKIIGDTLIIKIHESDYSETLIFDKEKYIIINKKENIQYNIQTNKLFK